MNTVAAGTVSLASAVTAQSLVLSDLLPGETVERVLVLTNDGTLALGSLVLEVTGEGNPLLNPAGGVQLEVARCPGSWAVGPGPRPTARCASVPTTVGADRPLLGRAPLDRSVLDVDEPGGVDHLRLTVRLSETAAPTLARQRATVAISFPAGQRSPNVR